MLLGGHLAARHALQARVTAAVGPGEVLRKAGVWEEVVILHWADLAQRAHAASPSRAWRWPAAWHGLATPRGPVAP
eukprot:183325-Lingulodinium_polyedra.AAC.1